MSDPASCKDCKATTRKLAKPGPRCAECRRKQAAAASERRWAASLMKKYGLAVDDYHALYLKQGGRCAICQRATGARRRLAVDHDHRTGLVRGLLCSVDNHEVVGIMARDDPEYFRRGYEYLTNPPAKQLGINAKAED